MGLSRTLFILPILSAALQAATPSDLTRTLVSTHNLVFGVDNQILVPLKDEDARKWPPVLDSFKEFVKTVKDPDGKCNAQMAVLAEAGNGILMEKLRAYNQAIKPALSGNDLDFTKIAWRDLNECRLQVSRTAERVTTVKEALKGLGGGGLFSRPSQELKDALALMGTLAEFLDVTCKSFETSYQKVALSRDAQVVGQAAEKANGKLTEGLNLLLKPLDPVDLASWQKAKSDLIAFVKAQAGATDAEAMMATLNKADENFISQRQASWEGTIKKCLMQKVPVGLPRIDKEKIDFSRLVLAPVSAGSASLQADGTQAREFKASIERTISAKDLKRSTAPRLALELVSRFAGMVSMETMLLRNSVADLQQAKDQAR